MWVAVSIYFIQRGESWKVQQQSAEQDVLHSGFIVFNSNKRSDHQNSIRQGVWIFWRQSGKSSASKCILWQWWYHSQSQIFNVRYVTIECDGQDITSKLKEHKVRCPQHFTWASGLLASFVLVPRCTLCFFWTFLALDLALDPGTRLKEFRKWTMGSSRFGNKTHNWLIDFFLRVYLLSFLT